VWLKPARKRFVIYTRDSTPIPRIVRELPFDCPATCQKIKVPTPACRGTMWILL
jgi:hypothetical protein